MADGRGRVSGQQSLVERVEVGELLPWGIWTRRSEVRWIEGYFEELSELLVLICPDKEDIMQGGLGREMAQCMSTLSMWGRGRTEPLTDGKGWPLHGGHERRRACCAAQAKKSRTN